MIVISLTDCPPSLRGDLTKWLQEINTGVYVGQVNARVRDELWNRVINHIKSGRATMVYSASNEQQLNFRVHNTSWQPIDFDGLKLMLRPNLARWEQNNIGFSKASRIRKAKNFSQSKQITKSWPNVYIVLDVETTGLSIIEDEIIEIGALLVSEGHINKQFQVLIKPKKKIPSAITSLTGITDHLLDQEGKELSSVLPDFLTFVGDFPIVSHNADFDFGFLYQACKRFALPPFSNRCINTLEIARRTIYDVKNYKLSTLLEYFNIETQGSHRCIVDCLTTFQLYNKLIEYDQNKK